MRCYMSHPTRRAQCPCIAATALVFFTEGMTRAFSQFTNDPSESRPIFYVARMLAYLVLIAAMCARTTCKLYGQADLGDQRQTIKYAIAIVIATIANRPAIT